MAGGGVVHAGAEQTREGTEAVAMGGRGSGGEALLTSAVFRDGKGEGEGGACYASEAGSSGMSRLIFLGTGSSTGVPTPLCVLQPSDPPCSVCHKAMQQPPHDNANYRCNPSLLIHHRPASSSQVAASHRGSFIQIDAGKCFREQVLRWFPRYQIPTIDALVLTHEHADAILGLDDVRGVQADHPFNQIPPLPVFLSPYSFQSVSEKFPYLLPKRSAADMACADVAPANVAGGSMEAAREVRRVAQLQWNVIEESLEKPFEAAGLEMVPLPVMHGEDYCCLGFAFGRRQRVVYISDVSRIPPQTMAYLQQQRQIFGSIHLLVLDSLYKERKHNTHLCLPQSLATIKQIQPSNALLIGMTHEFDHDQVNEELLEWSQRERINVQLSRDGLCVYVNL